MKQTVRSKQLTESPIHTKFSNLEGHCSALNDVFVKSNQGAAAGAFNPEQLRKGHGTVLG